MALSSHSVFYFGHEVTDANNLIPFKDGTSAEKIAQVPVGFYTLTKFVEVVVASLNAASSLAWSYNIDRNTRRVTLQASGPASLLFSSGSVGLNSPYALLGFNREDYILQTLFAAESASGKEYTPQFPLQDYSPKEKNKELVGAVVSKSATGDTVSVQSFGVNRYIKLNIKFITNTPTTGVLRYDFNAIEKAVEFMDFIVNKAPIEFMADENDRATFDRAYLESTPQSPNGTEYELKEYYDRGLPDFYETGLLTFKVINKE